jgi:hypothetical protein
MGSLLPFAAETAKVRYGPFFQACELEVYGCQ